MSAGSSGGAWSVALDWRAEPRCAARAATVGASKSARRGSSTWRAERMRETTCVASREWPPSSKKLSWMPTRSTWSTWAQMPARRCSSSLRGAT